MKKKAQDGTFVPKRNVGKDIKAERSAASSKNKAIRTTASNKAKELKSEAKNERWNATDLDLSHLPGGGHRPTGWDQEKVNLISSELKKSAKKKDSLAGVEQKKVVSSIKNPKYKSALKSGGKIKKKS